MLISFPQESRRPRSATFSISLLAHAAFLAVVWQIGGPRIQPVQTSRRPGALTFLAPPPATPSKFPRPNPIRVEIPRISPAAAPRLPIPEASRVETPTRAPEVSLPVEPSPRPLPALPRPAPTSAPEVPAIRTNVFSTPPAAPVPGIHKEVQMDSFQRTAGGPSGGDRNTRAIVSNAGFGEASGVARSGSQVAVRPGVSSASGFGDAAGATQSRPSTKVVRDGAFGAVTAAAPTAAAKRQTNAAVSRPVEILRKPHPEYTEEGRKRQIEGEVLLEVLFRANGEVRVQRLIRGLGHGLDENALKAARAIQFRPALEKGSAVDSVATVRITFQLAY